MMVWYHSELWELKKIVSPSISTLSTLFAFTAYMNDDSLTVLS